ncbi:hypothetical protein ADUPG1_001282, partial [Aduncisulcus paluster]
HSEHVHCKFIRKLKVLSSAGLCLSCGICPIDLEWGKSKREMEEEGEKGGENICMRLKYNYSPNTSSIFSFEKDRIRVPPLCVIKDISNTIISHGIRRLVQGEKEEEEKKEEGEITQRIVICDLYELFMNNVHRQEEKQKKKEIDWQRKKEEEEAEILIRLDEQEEKQSRRERDRIMAENPKESNSFS